MRIIVISDSHQNYRNLREIISRHLDADLFLHLGDGESECTLLRREYPQIDSRLYNVKGNCDYESLPMELTLDLIPGYRLFATHGHRYGVRAGIGGLLRAAREEGCNIALYGHTHVSQTVYEDGIYVMNPGSAACPRDGNPPSYGILDVTTAGVMQNVVFLR